MTDANHEGGCLCGALRYRVRDRGVLLTACHCTDCQRTSGGAFSLSLIVQRASVELLQGTPQVFEQAYEDGRRKLFHFCGACSVRIWNEMSRVPQVINVKPGTLDDTSWLEPAAHLWLRSKQPWVTVPEGVLAFEQQPEDFMPIVQAYAAQQARA